MRALAKYSTTAIAAVLVFSAACRDAVVPETPPLPLEPAVSAAVAGSQDRTPPTKPANLRVTATAAFSVSLAWNASTDNSGNFSYRIRHSWGYEATVPKTQTSFTWTSHLESRQTYSFYVYAVDGAGNKSPVSNTVTVTLPRDISPPTAPVLAATDVGPTHISLAWSSTDDGPYIFYSISVNGSPDPYGLTSSTSRTFYLLEPATTYAFTARARDNGPNWSPVSQPLTVTTKPRDASDTQAPTTPTNLRVDGYQNEAEFTLTWTASTDNVDPQSTIRYDVYVNGTLSDITVGTTRSINYGVNGTNTISVIAVDAAGNRSAAGTTTWVIQF